MGELSGLAFRTQAEGDESKLSYWNENSAEPLDNSTIGELIERAAIDYSSRTAISVFDGTSLTYAEALNKSDRLAAALTNLGLRRGDHVAIWGFNSVEWYLSYLAAFRAGFVVVNLNPLYQVSELSSCLQEGDVKALLMDDELGECNFYNVLKTIVPELELCDYNACIDNEHLPLLKTVIVFSQRSYKGTHKWDELLSSMMVDDPRVDMIKISQSQTNQFDVCNLQFTSGTTSKPKGVLLTHRSMVNAARVGSKRKKLGETIHRLCLHVPFFHAYGSVQGILACVYSGSTIVLPSRKFSPNKSLDCIIRERCTVVYGTPTMHKDLLNVYQKRSAVESSIADEISCVQLISSGGAICLPETVSTLKKCFKNSRFVSGYGMTETCSVAFSSLLTDSNELLLTSVGRVMDHMEVKVVNKNDEIVPLGTPGELCCKGYAIMNGYYKEPDQTKLVLRNGWLRTGDKFILMENGYGQIVGRFKDLIIRGGENIDPKEIEELLIKHPGVNDVQVYGIKDARLGEVVAAAIVKDDVNLTAEDVKKYCYKMIASYKIPQHVLFVEEFPKTASGKVQKFKLREMTELESPSLKKF